MRACINAVRLAVLVLSGMALMQTAAAAPRSMPVAKEKSAMVKLMIVGRRTPGQTRTAALGHLRDVHARMVVSPPADAGAMPADYVQNHVTDGAYPAAGGAYAIERDLVTELWFESPDHLRASVSTPYYLANLKPDEPRFVDDESVAKLMVRAHPIFGNTDGRYKAFLLLGRGADSAGWDGGRTALAARFKSAGANGAVDNEALPPPTGGQPFVDHVFELWFATPQEAAAFVDKFDDHLALFGTNGVDRSRSFALTAEQYDSARLRAHHVAFPGS